MARRLVFPGLVIIAGLLLIGLALANATPIRAQDGEHGDDPAVLRGSVVFAEFCAACHGPQGEAIGAGPGFASIQEYDVELAQERISAGYDSDPATPFLMVGYGEEAGGPLTEEQITDVLAYMATWAEGTTPPLPRPNLKPGDTAPTGAGSPDEGAVVYAYSCLGCHGRDAKGRGLDHFPRFKIDENTLRIAATGDGHGVVAPFADNAGGPLTSADLDNLDAYLRTIVTAEEEDEDPQGVNILLIVMGLGAVAAVGGFYLAATRQKGNAN